MENANNLQKQPIINLKKPIIYHKKKSMKKKQSNETPLINEKKK